MVDVQFQDEQKYAPQYNSLKRSQPSFLVKFVMKIGIARNVQQANIVLLVIAVVAIIIGFVMYPSAPSATDQGLSPEDQAIPLNEGGI